MPFRHIPGTQQTRGTNDTSIREWYIWRDLWTAKYETDGFYHIFDPGNDYKPCEILETIGDKLKEVLYMKIQYLFLLYELI